MRWICVKLAKTLKIICVFVSQNRSNCLLNIMIIKKKSECNSIFFMILCIMVIVGGMARFSPALIYRRFIFETRSVGGCWLSLPIMRIFGVHMRCPSPPFNHLIKKLILLKLETKTYSTSRLGWEVAPWHPLAPSFKSISENPLSRKTLKKRCQKVPRCQPTPSLLSS